MSVLNDLQVYEGDNHQPPVETHLLFEEGGEEYVEGEKVALAAGGNYDNESRYFIVWWPHTSKENLLQVAETDELFGENGEVYDVENEEFVPLESFDVSDITDGARGTYITNNELESDYRLLVEDNGIPSYKQAGLITDLEEGSDDYFEQVAHYFGSTHALDSVRDNGEDVVARIQEELEF